MGGSHRVQLSALETVGGKDLEPETITPSILHRYVRLGVRVASDSQVAKIGGKLGVYEGGGVNSDDGSASRSDGTDGDDDAYENEVNLHSDTAAAPLGTGSLVRHKTKFTPQAGVKLAIMHAECFPARTCSISSPRVSLSL